MLEGSNRVCADIVNCYTDLAAQWAIGISVGNLLEPAGWHLRVWHLGGQHTSLFMCLCQSERSNQKHQGASLFKCYIFFIIFFFPSSQKLKVKLSHSSGRYLFRLYVGNTGNLTYHTSLKNFGHSYQKLTEASLSTKIIYWLGRDTITS